MKWHGIKRWLVGCAIGTSCSLGGILVVPQFLPADQPAPHAALGQPVPAPQTNRPAEPPALSTGSLGQPSLFIPDAPAQPDNSRAVISFERGQTSSHPPGDVQSSTGTENGKVIFIHTEVVDPNVGPSFKLPANPGAVIGPPVPVQANPNPPTVPAQANPQPPAAGLGFPQLSPVTDETPAEVRSAFPRAESVPYRKAFVDLSAAPCFGRAPDYSWIIGQAEYSSINKEWRLRYASVDEVDRFGGRVVLVENQHVNYLQDGMYVQVRGHLINPDTAGNQPAHYRIESFQTVTNPNLAQPSKAHTTPAPIKPALPTPPAPMNPAIPTTPALPATIPMPAIPNLPELPALPAPIPDPVLPDGISLPAIPD